jgi:hypothetical protein
MGEGNVHPEHGVELIEEGLGFGACTLERRVTGSIRRPEIIWDTTG